VAAALLFTIAAAGCSAPPPPDDADYATRVTRMREAKDTEFQRSSTPIPDSRKKEFLPLSYYPIDPAYNVPAVLKPGDRSVLDMTTSTGEIRKERRAGTLEFTLHGQPMTLTAFVEADAPNMDRLFLPFSDSTTGETTYNSGRFIDLDRTPTGIYELDFNKAYNPYCYYNLSFSCPLPPRENRLPIAIEAGEKTKEKS
jgi:uncharacterized protein (DUF1684 family)